METLVEQAKAYIENKKTSQAQFASAIGVSESTMSRWLKEDYPNKENVDRKVRTYLEKEELREQSTEMGSIDFVMTNISKNIWGVLDYSRWVSFTAMQESARLRPPESGQRIKTMW